MKNRINSYLLLIFILVACLVMPGCSNSGEKKNNDKIPSVGTSNTPSPAPAASTAPAKVASQNETSDIAASVDGSILKKSDLEKDVKDKLNLYKGKIPADKMKEARAKIKKQLIDEFIMRTLLTNEVEKRKITVNDKEIKITMDQIKASLPPDAKLETFMKENKISKEQIALGVKVNKMVQKDVGNKAKPSQKEINKFYDDNKDKFIIPENAHVRHILIAVNNNDDNKTKADKKAKIENLRKQIVDGADFAEIALKNSDCPSKENGGDLGRIKKGQTVKPFEDAVFTQDIKAVGPVVTTEYGYHIIQVLERSVPKTVPLEEVKGKISSYLEQQKQANYFNEFLNKLRAQANIVVNEK